MKPIGTNNQGSFLSVPASIDLLSVQRHLLLGANATTQYAIIGNNDLHEPEHRAPTLTGSQGGWDLDNEPTGTGQDAQSAPHQDVLPLGFGNSPL